MLMLVSGWYLFSCKPRHDFYEMLSGDSSIQISQVEFSNFGNPAFISDPESAAYLSTVMRAARQGGSVSGVRLSAVVHLTNGGTTSCTICYGGDKQFGVSLGDTLLPDHSDNYYQINMTEPVPEEIRKTLDILIKR
jgi:hypothetical protein